MRTTINADTYDLMTLAEVLGVESDPGTDPAAWMREMREALEGALAQLTGDDTEDETDEEPAGAVTVAGNSGLPSYLRNDGRDFDKTDTIPTTEDHLSEPTHQDIIRRRGEARNRKKGGTQVKGRTPSHDDDFDSGDTMPVLIG